MLLSCMNCFSVVPVFFFCEVVDAAVRSSISDRIASIALPGGIGTLDEVFEILALIQLELIGSELPFPFIFFFLIFYFL